MDSPAETHYVSFLGGDGGGMGPRGPSFRRRSLRDSKRFHLMGLRAKAQLLAAAVLASVVLCVGFLLWASKSAPGSPDAVLIPVEDTAAAAAAAADPAAAGQLPLKIYEWEESHFMMAFSKFMIDHSKTYASLQEKQRRFKIFKANVTHIFLHNEQGHSYSLGINKFADWTREEFSAFVKGVKANPLSQQHSRLGLASDLSSAASDLPVSVDWRSRGCVTPPKDQGQCGSCWAFSTTGAIEGCQCAKTGRLISLSEQMLMDCSRYLGNHSCSGGLMDDAFSFVTEKGLCAEADYPYEARDGKCRASKCRAAVKLQGFYDVPRGDEAAMRAALARHGPVSVAIQADQVDFQFYKEGVFDAPCGTNLDHGVLIVGYGTDERSKKDFFIMKNSWGPDWGQQGYMLMAQHRGNEGQCGLLLSASYPLVEGDTPPHPK